MDPVAAWTTRGGAPLGPKPAAFEGTRSRHLSHFRPGPVEAGSNELGGLIWP
jgi:hypothetical protein